MANELRIDDPGLVQDEAGLYELNDDGAAMLREAVADTRPRLRGTDVDDYLARRLKELGRD